MPTEEIIPDLPHGAVVRTKEIIVSNPLICHLSGGHLATLLWTVSYLLHAAFRPQTLACATQWSHFSRLLGWPLPSLPGASPLSLKHETLQRNSAPKHTQPRGKRGK